MRAAFRKLGAKVPPAIRSMDGELIRSRGVWHHAGAEAPSRMILA
jgi:hypothetical protein